MDENIPNLMKYIKSTYPRSAAKLQDKLRDPERETISYCQKTETQEALLKTNYKIEKKHFQSI